MKNQNIIKLPKQKEVEKAIITSIKNGNKTRSKIILASAKILGLTENEIKDRAPDSKNTKFKSIIGTVLTQLTNNHKININNKDTRQETYSLVEPKNNKNNKRSYKTWK